MHKNFIILICSILTFSACSSIRSMSPYSPSVETSTEARKNYSLNNKKSVYVGENIIEIVNFTYIVSSPTTFKALRSAGRCFSSGTLYPVIGADTQDNSLYVKYCNSQVSGVRISPDGVVIDDHMFYYNLGGWQNHLGVNIGAPIGDKLFEPAEVTKKLGANSFKIEIIYAGFDGNNIKVAYREYKDDIARPAFYQDLVYNITKSKLIRYKNFKIQVTRATSEELEYIVLSDS